MSSKRPFLEPMVKRARRKSYVPRLKAIKTSDLTSLGQVLKLMEGQARFCTGKTQLKRGEEYFPQMVTEFSLSLTFFIYRLLASLSMNISIHILTLYTSLTMNSRRCCLLAPSPSRIQKLTQWYSDSRCLNLDDSLNHLLEWNQNGLNLNFH